MILTKRACVWLALSALVGCDSPTASEENLNLHTGRSSYAVESGGIGKYIVVDLRYTNTLSEPVHIGHCGGFPARLDKRAGGKWIVVGGTGSLDCAGTTRIVNPGTSIAQTVQFDGAPRGSNIFPQFNIDDLAGTYRIVLMEVMVDRHENPFSNGSLIPERLRVSNTFQVVE